jgi:GAF domain-containing protein
VRRQPSGCQRGRLAISNKPNRAAPAQLQDLRLSLRLHLMLDNDGFRWEAAAVLRRAVGFDGWCWLLADPEARLPTRDLGENAVGGQSVARFSRRHPDASALPWQRSAGPVVVTSAVTGGDLARDPVWRETFGPAGVGDYLSAPLIAGRTCWGQLHLHRDGSEGFFSAGDAGLPCGIRSER